MVGNTFSRRVAKAFRLNGFSMLDIWAMTFPFRKTLCETCPVSSFASAMARLKLSGLMPMSVPVNVFPVVVATMTVLSTSAATSVKNFLCAIDTFIIHPVPYECATQLFIFDFVKRQFGVGGWLHAFLLCDFCL